MSRILKSLIRSKLQKWPYDELKDNTNEQIIEFYREVAWIGTEHRYQNILAFKKNKAYNQIGTGLVVIVFGYIVGALAVMLVPVYIIYHIVHSTGGH